MKKINILVNKKIATAMANSEIVCGNTDQQLVFTFDGEWNAHNKKTARFIYGGRYEDVIFSGNTCPVPLIFNTNSVEVGVYAGDISLAPSELYTTTRAKIKCNQSILCGNVFPRPESARNFIIEAKRAAVDALVAEEQAEAAAREAKESAREAAEYVGNADYATVAGEAQHAVNADVAANAYYELQSYDNFDGYSGQPRTVQARLKGQTNLGAMSNEASARFLSEKVLGGTEGGKVEANGAQYYVDLKYDNLYKLKNGTYWLSGNRFEYAYDEVLETYSMIEGREDKALSPWHMLWKVGNEGGDVGVLALPVVENDTLMYCRPGRKPWQKVFDNRNTKQTVYSNKADILATDASNLTASSGSEVILAFAGIYCVSIKTNSGITLTGHIIIDDLSVMASGNVAEGVLSFNPNGKKITYAPAENITVLSIKAYRIAEV